MFPIPNSAIATQTARYGLLLFAIGSLIYMTATEWRQRSVGADADVDVAVGPSTRLIVYYFSQGKECITCEHIPQYARETLETHFAAELKSGVIVWREIDVDNPANEHYIDQYGLFTKSIVLEQVMDSQPIQWENLDRVWDYVYDKERFVEYMRAAIRKKLDVLP
ncbi:MAG: hypothetical protein AMXMBFR84_44900 [Candidatus Hydrogenedentota bacterium]